jgi:hypothetical protein
MPDELRELEARSRRARDPFIVHPARKGPGGVDPLGLRQINFDLMNKVFPGLNNVARHIRPFTLVTWAWRRTISLARQRKLVLPVSAHEDFVARIEVAFAWSMLLHRGGADLDLPGKRTIKRRWGDAKQINFGDEEWLAFAKARRNSTSLIAAINYGPGLRAFRLLGDDLAQPGARVEGKGTEAMLDAFEDQISPMLSHKLFRGWDACALSRKQAVAWGEIWDMDGLLDAEREAFHERLLGKRASPARRAGFQLLRHALAEWECPEESDAREAMCEVDYADTAEIALAWRRLQVRQAFRLALEALLEWVVREIGDDTLTTAELSRRLIEAAGGKPMRAGDWLRKRVPAAYRGVDALAALETSFASASGLERAIMAGIGVSVLAPKDLQDGSDRRERLPIALAAADFARLQDGPRDAFVAHVIEQWVIAQHTYWSVGRGLADARSGNRSILRLRLVLEPTGWRVTRGRGSRSMPRSTPDRVRTAISLAREANVLEP